MVVPKGCWKSDWPTFHAEEPSISASTPGPKASWGLAFRARDLEETDQATDFMFTLDMVSSLDAFRPCGWSLVGGFPKEASTQRLLGLSMEDPTPPLDTPEVVGGLKTRLFEGPKSLGSLWVEPGFRSKSKPAALLWRLPLLLVPTSCP